MSQQEETRIAQTITRLCSDQEHSMPVLPPDDWEEEHEEEDEEPVYKHAA